MPAMNKRGKKWDVKDGKAVLVTPAVKETSEQMPVGRLDREIERAGRKKAAATEAVAKAQDDLDKATTYEAELVAIRAQVSDD